jgi:hypothetical protein
MSGRRRLNSKHKLRGRLTGALPQRLYTRGGEIRIPAPANLSLAENYEEVIDFVARIIDLIINPRRAVMDFATIRRVSLGAALTLAASLDMWQRLKSRRLLARDAGLWRPDVRQALIELGLFELLKTRNPPQESWRHRQDLTILKLRSGEGSDGSLARELMRAMVEIAGPIEAERFLFAGLTEAMTNVAQHAYPDAEFEGVPPNYRRWWMTGSYDSGQHCMRILILDLGVGIPATLPRSTNERIRGVVSSIVGGDDAAMIAAAFQAGRSSTGELGRGHGLEEVRQFMEQCERGRLRILSGRGEVVYEKGREEPRRRTLPTPFSGTLIEWEVFR